MDKTLDDLLARRAAERLATRVLPERAAEFRQERTQTPAPVAAEKPQVATEREARFMPAQPGPSIGPGSFTSRTAMRENAAGRDRATQRDEKAEQAGAAIFAGGMNKIDPLERLMARKMLERHADRPAPKLALGLTRGLER